jgi:predicted O-methyltransferase YrrM
MELIVPTTKENRQLQRLGAGFKRVSEMKPSESEFLNALISRYQPRKIVEMGVAAGSSAVVMLNAIRNISQARLYSIDKSTNYYRDENKKTGFVVDDYPQLKEKWQLYTGDYALKFLDQIGGGIDFCLIDTVHINPGEILDVLMILPYLKKQAVVVFHDVNYQAVIIGGKANCTDATTNNTLMSAMAGEKLLPKNFEKQHINVLGLNTYIPFANIGAVITDADILSRVWEIFNLLSLPWKYTLCVKEQKAVAKFLARFYEPILVAHFNQAAKHNRQYLLVANDDESPTEVKLKALVHRLCAYKRKIFNS